MKMYSDNTKVLGLDVNLIKETHSSLPVSLWLLSVALLIFFMIFLGGYTRLSKSGLSMTKWKAFGYKFPSTPEEWQREFEWY